MLTYCYTDLLQIVLFKFLWPLKCPFMLWCCCNICAIKHTGPFRGVSVLMEESCYSSDCTKLSLHMDQSQYEETQEHQQLTRCCEWSQTRNKVESQPLLSWCQACGILGDYTALSSYLSALTTFIACLCFQRLCNLNSKAANSKVLNYDLSIQA